MFGSLNLLALENRPPIWLRGVLVVTIVGIVFALSSFKANAQPDSGVGDANTYANVEWRTGQALDRYLKDGFGASLYDADLGPRLRAFAVQQRVAVFIDRRIDPSNKINIGIKNGTLEQFFWAIGGSLEIGVCRIGDLHYFGPSDVAAQLPLLSKSLTDAAPESRSKSKVPWTKRERLTTNEVAIPARLLEQLASQNGFKIRNIEAISHDVWRPLNLPSMTLENRVAILLVGFNKWFERSKDGTQIRIIDLPNVKSGQRVFPNLKDTKALAQKIKQDFPGAKVSSRETAITATGSPKDLALIERFLVESYQFDTGAATEDQVKTYTMNTEAARGSILASIAQQTDRKFVYDRPAPAALRAQLKIQVKDLVVEDLVRKVLEGTGLKAQITDEELRIYE